MLISFLVWSRQRALDCGVARKVYGFERRSCPDAVERGPRVSGARVPLGLPHGRGAPRRPGHSLCPRRKVIVMIDRIGRAAGEVWQCIEKEGGTASLAKVREKTGLDTETALMALGWLAREDKIAMERRGRSLKILLLAVHAL
jgi:hypothetical protein